MSRGRSNELIDARNRKLLERWYYWTEVRRIRFDDAVRILSTQEFFISEFTVWQIIRKMIIAGEKVNGQDIPRKMFSGFRVKPTKAEPSYSLFP